MFQDRDPQANVTTLSGDIQTVGTDDTDSAFHVVVGADKIPRHVDASSPYDYGGGMYNEDVSPVVTNCIFNDNSANYGGGMFNDSSSPTITNCLFYDNETIDGSGGDGAAIYCYDHSDATIANCTISQNMSDDVAGGILANSYSDPQIKNSIVWGNEDSLGDSDIDANNNSSITVTYSDYGIDYDDSTSSVNLQNCISADPQFADAANGDFHLRSTAGRWDVSSQNWTTDALSSPCITLGDPTDAYSLEQTPNGGGINAGAYGNTIHASKVELHPVTVILDTDDGLSLPPGAAWTVYYYPENVPYDGVFRTSGNTIQLPYDSYVIYCTLVNDYIAPLGLVITAGPGQPTQYTRTYQTLYRYVWASGGSDVNDGKTLQTAFRTIAKGMSDVPAGGTVKVLNGLYQENLTVPTGKAFTLEGESTAAIIDGQAGGRVFSFSSVSSSITIENFTIQGGRVDNAGGGAYIRNSDNITFDDCDFEDNEAYNYSGQAYGGAVYIQDCDPAFDYCSFDNNQVYGSADEDHGGFGGAIFTYNASATFDHCEIGETGNSATNNSSSDEIYTYGNTRPTYTYCKIRGWTQDSPFVDGDYMTYNVAGPSGSNNSDF